MIYTEIYEKILAESAMFADVPPEKIGEILSVLNAARKSFKSGEYILRSGERTDSLGIMLSGEALIINEDFWGNRNLIARICAKDMFAEAYALLPRLCLPVSVSAETDCAVMFVKTEPLLKAEYPFMQTILRNMLVAVAQKNRILNEKLTHMSKRTTRAKLMSYLSAESEKQQTAELMIPLKRQQLADFLGVERSAMSAELSSMQRDGLIKYKRNRFTLLSGSDFF